MVKMVEVCIYNNRLSSGDAINSCFRMNDRCGKIDIAAVKGSGDCGNVDVFV